MQIALDGPAGAGKSTIAKLTAKRLGFVYVDTGAMFRAMAYVCIEKGVDTGDEMAVKGCISDADVQIIYPDGRQHVIVFGEDVTDKLRDENVGKGASAIAKYACVRDKLLSLQREIASANDVIMDGRDIATVVLPDAKCKIYLTADSKVRAKRRYDELVAKGEKCDIDEIEKDIIARDEQDMNREIAPLKKAHDAIEIDTSDMTIDEVTDAISEIVNSKR